ncbi:hypothetical protein D3C86_1798830 [compost metagenome]
MRPADAAKNEVDLRAGYEHIRHNHRPAGLHQPQGALQENHRVHVVEIFKNSQRVDQFSLMFAQLQH